MLWIITSLATQLQFLSLILSIVISFQKTKFTLLLLIMSAFMIISALIVFAIFPFPAVSALNIFWQVSRRTGQRFALVILFNTMQKGEVSRINSGHQQFPIWWRISSLSWGDAKFVAMVSVVLYVAGRVLISSCNWGGRNIPRLQKSLYYYYSWHYCSSLSNIAIVTR